MGPLHSPESQSRQSACSSLKWKFYIKPELWNAHPCLKFFKSLYNIAHGPPQTLWRPWSGSWQLGQGHIPVKDFNQVWILTLLTLPGMNLNFDLVIVLHRYVMISVKTMSPKVKVTNHRDKVSHAWSVFTCWKNVWWPWTKVKSALSTVVKICVH
jgi:hypothetical protein